MDIGLTDMLFDAPDRPEYVASMFALSCEQVFPDGPVYHFIVYGGVPPDNDAVSVIDWPLSITMFAGLTEGEDSEGFIVNVFDEIKVFPTL